MAAFPYNTAQSEGGVVSTNRLKSVWGYSCAASRALVLPIDHAFGKGFDSRPHAQK